MDKNEIIIRSVVKESTGLSGYEFSDKFSDLGVSSIDLVSIVMGLEAAFGVKFGSEQQKVENFESVSSILKFFSDERLIDVDC